MNIKMNIVKYNNVLIKEDLNTLMDLNQYLNSFSKADCSILYLNFMRYNNFILLEMLEYLEKIYNIDIMKELKQKKSIKKIRAKLKCNAAVLCKLEDINSKMHMMFKKMNNPIIMKLFPSLCYNFAIFIYDKKVIANNFEVSAIMEKVIYSNNKIDKQKILSYSEEIGHIMKFLCKKFNVNCALNFNKKIGNELLETRDYELYKYIKDKDFSKYIFYLNKLVILNFYCSIILNKFKGTVNSLDLKLKYVICRNTVEELKQIENSFDSSSYSSIFDNIYFRNFMYHYIFPKNIFSIDEEKVLFGICEELLSVDETILNSLLNSCISELISYFTKEINESRYSFLLS